MVDRRAHTGSKTSLRGFLLQVFQRPHDSGACVYAVGRLENGQTFGIVDRRLRPSIYVRRADAGAAVAAATSEVRIRECGLSTLGGQTVVCLECHNADCARRLAAALRAAGIRTYQGDLLLEDRYRMEHACRSSVRLSGPWRQGRGVDRVYTDPHLEPCAWTPELVVLVVDIRSLSPSERILAATMAGMGPLPRHRGEEMHLLDQSAAVDHAQAYRYPDESSLLRGLIGAIQRRDPDVLTGWRLMEDHVRVLRSRCRMHGIECNLGRVTDIPGHPASQTRGAGGRLQVYGRQLVDAMHLERLTRPYGAPLAPDQPVEAPLPAGVFGAVEAVEARPPDGVFAAPDSVEAVEMRPPAGGFAAPDSAAAQPPAGVLSDAVARNGRSSGTKLPGSGGTQPASGTCTDRADGSASVQACLDSCRRVRDLLIRKDLIRLTVRRSLLTGLPLDRAWGRIAAFDLLYTSELRRRGMVAPSIGIDRPLVSPPGQRRPGGRIQPAPAGLRPHVLAFRFRSLYPALIRTFNLDPLAHARGRRGAARVLVAPNGAPFARQPGILPTLLGQLHASQARAAARGDLAAARVDSLLMDSFYPLLATDACRYARESLAAAVSGFARHVLEWTHNRLQETGQQVLYASAHSLFVDSRLEQHTTTAQAHGRGVSLCRWINDHLADWIRRVYGVESHLRLGFEHYYARFMLLPRLGRNRGGAPDYAGLRINRDGTEELEIGGPGAARPEGIRLAQQLQRDLVDLVLHGAPTAMVEQRVTDCVRALRAGTLDADLACTCFTEQPQEAYPRSAVPQARAGRLLPSPSGPGYYLQTVDGPQLLGRRTAPLDYDYYIRNHITPVVRTLAQVAPLDADAVVQGVASLFGEGPLV